MEFLSVISKGSIKDKLMWTFTFYDVDHDGVISREEMLKVWVDLRFYFFLMSMFDIVMVLTKFNT